MSVVKRSKKQAKKEGKSRRNWKLVYITVILFNIIYILIFYILMQWYK